MNTTVRKSVLNLGTVLSAAIFAASTGVAMAAQIKLSGDQEVPPVQTSAQGTGTITVKEDKTVTGSVKITGMKANEAHIHEGAPGATGPAVIPLKKSGAAGDTWTVPPGTKLTDEQYQSYQSGKLYVNVHSPKYKDGEVRGQIDPTASGGNTTGANPSGENISDTTTKIKPNSKVNTRANTKSDSN